MNEMGGNEFRDYLIQKWNGEEVGGAINAVVDGKRITLARLEKDGYHLTMLGSFWEARTQSVSVEVVGAEVMNEVSVQDEPVQMTLTEAVNVEVEAPAPKPKRGVRRPKVDALEI